MANKDIFVYLEKNIKPFYSQKDSDLLTIREFVKAELLLYLNHYFGAVENAKNAYFLLSRLNIIGKPAADSDDYLLFTARIMLKELRAKKVWEDLLLRYKRVNPDIKLFKIDEKDRLTIKESENIPYSQRKVDYWELLNKYPKKKTGKVNIVNGGESYSFIRKKDIEVIKLPFIPCENTNELYIRVRKGEAITVSREALIKAAKEMDELISRIAGCSERNNWFESMNNLLIKEVNKGNVLNSSEVIIDKICNVVGMVGAGKSTFMKVATYWAAKNGYRTVMVLDSVAEVLKTVRFFERLGINVVPLLGRYSRNEQLNKAIEWDSMFLEQEYSKHLTAVCPLDGLRINANDRAFDYGEEPCYSLLKCEADKTSSSTYICPLYYRCPAMRNERALGTADLVVTTPAGLIYGRSPYPIVGEKLKFIEQAMKDFDLVIFDEADRIQAIFDSEFCPTSSLDELLRENAELAKEYMEAAGRRLELSKEERNFQDQVLWLPNICDVVKELINHNKAISEWERIGKGSSFSAMILIEKDSSIPDAVKEDLKKYYEGDKLEGLSNILSKIESSADEFRHDGLIREWIERNEAVSSECFIRIKFILNLIVLENRLRYISDYGTAADIERTSGRQLSGFLRNQFRKLQDYLPVSAAGNIFGFVYDKEKGDIKVFRQYAFGRALMLCLPYLLMDEAKHAIGPNVLLLSGTSWAKGSHKYHIWADVNYILEADPKVRDIIEKMKVIKLETATRVSGSGSQRSIMLKDIIRQCHAYIEMELRENPQGRILFVVNSYSEAFDAKCILQEQFPKEKIHYMIKDDEDEKERAIRRSEIDQFFKIDSRMLVAPAGAIERGHNIVDEIGHSILTSVFFLSRPMEVPGDIEEAVIKLNGKVSELANNLPTANTFARMKAIRLGALRAWGKLLGGDMPKLDYMDGEEKRDLAVTRLVIIHQIFGRLARIADFNRPAPTIYFADGAFKAKYKRGFDLLDEMMRWMSDQIDFGHEREVAETLYGPFYRACRKGLGYNE